MRYTIIILAALLCQGCSTIFHGQNQNVDCTSDPAGAEVYHHEQLQGITPCQVTLDRDVATVLVFRHPEYPEAITIQLQPKFNGATFGNLLMGGLIGAAVDAGTGANYTLSPDPAHAQFSKPLPKGVRQ